MVRAPHTGETYIKLNAFIMEIAQCGSDVCASGSSRVNSKRVCAQTQWRMWRNRSEQMQYVSEHFITIIVGSQRMNEIVYALNGWCDVCCCRSMRCKAYGRESGRTFNRMSRVPSTDCVCAKHFLWTFVSVFVYVSNSNSTEFAHSSRIGVYIRSYVRSFVLHFVWIGILFLFVHYMLMHFG